MMILPINQVPNQAFSIQLDGNSWNFTLKTAQDTTVVSLTLNNVDILDGGRAVAGGFIIPSKYQENGAGNFFFTTQNFELPYYTQFNVTQYLVYISDAELTAISAAREAAAASKITPAFFNPIAGLPLRFSPQGYT